MANIQAKRIYEPAGTTDGFMVLIDRLWPRGISKEEARIDLWAKDIAPSTGLRKDFHTGKIPWPLFEELYRSELLNNPALDAFVDAVKDKETTTLLFAAKDTVQTHAKVVLGVLAQKLNG